MSEATVSDRFPVFSSSDLRRAVDAVPSEPASTRGQLRKHCVTEAMIIGRPDLIPGSWRIRLRRKEGE